MSDTFHFTLSQSTLQYFFTASNARFPQELELVGDPTRTELAGPDSEAETPIKAHAEARYEKLSYGLVRLPNGHRASVDLRRLRDYILNPQHEIGRDKARVFRSVFDLSAETAEHLQAALLEAASSVDATKTRRDDYGQRYRIDFDFVRADRRGTIRSAWFLPADEDYPRFLSCWVLLNSLRDA